MNFWRMAPVVLTAFLASGCIGTKSLRTVPVEKVGTVKVKSPITVPQPRVVTITIKRFDEGTQGGSLAEIIARESVHAASGGTERQMFGDIRKTLQRPEPRILLQTLESKLAQSGHALGSTADSTLMLEIRSFGLEEITHQHFAPFIRGTAKLVNSHNNLVWTGDAQGSCLVGRTLTEYEQNPPAYESDFTQAANDLCHQLISGPIRPLR